MLEKNEGPLIVKHKIFLHLLHQARYLCYSELPFVADFLST